MHLRAYAVEDQGTIEGSTFADGLGGHKRTVNLPKQLLHHSLHRCKSWCCLHLGKSKPRWIIESQVQEFSTAIKCLNPFHNANRIPSRFALHVTNMLTGVTSIALSSPDMSLVSYISIVFLKASLWMPSDSFVSELTFPDSKLHESQFWIVLFINTPTLSTVTVP